MHGFPTNHHAPPDLLAVVDHDDSHFGLHLSAAQKADRVEFLKSL